MIADGFDASLPLRRCWLPLFSPLPFSPLLPELFAILRLLQAFASCCFRQIAPLLIRLSLSFISLLLSVTLMIAFIDADIAAR